MRPKDWFELELESQEKEMLEADKVDEEF